MRTRSRERSAPRAGGFRRGEQASDRRGSWLAIGVDRLAADKSADGAAPYRPALVRAEWIAVEEVLPPDGAFVRQIHEPQVSVVSGGDVALAFEAEAAGDVGRRDRRDVGELEAVLGEQQLPRRLAARDPHPHLAEVGTPPQLPRTRRMGVDDPG